MITEAELNGMKPKNLGNYFADDFRPIIYRPFEGRYIDAMPRLRADNRRPMTAKDIAEKRVEVLKSKDANLINAWVNHYYDTSSGVAYFGNEIKIIPNCEILANIDSDAKLKNGALILTPEQYKSLEGKVLNRDELKLQAWLTKQEAKEHPVWKELLGDALNPYTDAIFKFGKEKYDIDNLMGIWIANAQKEPTLRSWYFSNLDRRSVINGLSNLDYGGARLVGVPE